jgi:hypothetical protein
MKKVILALLLYSFFSGEALASSAKSVVETQVEGSENATVYQSVEAIVNGKTIKKESREPGKLEVELKDENGAESQKIDSSPAVFSWENEEPSPSLAPTPTFVPDNSGDGIFFQTLLNSIERFFGALVSNLTRLFE